MKHPFIAVILLCVCCLLHPISSYSQTGGTITGRVIDQTDLVVPGVSVELLASGAADHIKTLTGDDGLFRFENVQPGPAEVTFRLINFGTIRRNVAVTAGSTTTVNVMLVVPQAPTSRLPRR
jgi:hypothetical protein